MKTHAFKMLLKPGFEKEYKKRHDEIWPELQELLERSGITQYCIYLDEESSTLFAFQNLEDNNTTAVLPKHPIVKKWWDYMADIMETNPDNAPIEQDLINVFEL